MVEAKATRNRVKKPEVTSFTDQGEVCDFCGATVEVNTILDLDSSRYYFICPECDSANAVV